LRITYVAKSGNNSQQGKELVYSPHICDGQHEFSVFDIRSVTNS